MLVADFDQHGQHAMDPTAASWRKLWEQQETGLPHNPLQRPAGLVSRSSGLGEVVQQAAQQAAVTVFEEVARWEPIGWR